jgi:hypothetical protein
MEKSAALRVVNPREIFSGTKTGVAEMFSEVKFLADSRPSRSTRCSIGQRVVHYPKGFARCETRNHCVIINAPMNDKSLRLLVVDDHARLIRVGERFAG